MRKNEFLKALSRALRPLKDEERQRYLANYAELVEDQLESGMTEETAIAKLGDPAAIALPILDDAREQGLLKPRRTPMNICLLALGSPVWVSLLLAGLAVVLALYVAAWALVIAVCALEMALAVMLPAAIVFFAVNAASNLPFGLFVLGAGIVCAAAAAALWKPLKGLIARFAVSSAHWVCKIVNNMKIKGGALL